MSCQAKRKRGWWFPNRLGQRRQGHHRRPLCWVAGVAYAVSAADLLPVPGRSPQVVRRRRLDPRLASTPLADRPGGRAAQALQPPVRFADQPSVFEHGAEERTGLVAADLQPVLEGGES
jgi:hypothetical protein